MTAREQKRRNRQRQSSLDDARLGYRINDFCRLTGISRVSVWRAAKAGKLKLAYIGRIPIIPADEAHRILLPVEAA